jgi:hypothetical protein
MQEFDDFNYRIYERKMTFKVSRGDVLPLHLEVSNAIWQLRTLMGALKPKLRGLNLNGRCVTKQYFSM